MASLAQPTTASPATSSPTSAKLLVSDGRNTGRDTGGNLGPNAGTGRVGLAWPAVTISFYSS
ncbi:hypothetical protein [Candidatus Ichthyocystis sparus]|uniref:hypothetical protein n=1 Tax=Candidatus Ichthyocystis sparus TaxID=1561004 RepID=UPI001146F78E|nr:hypothetical protein [Candidatus Ichthyocystis sparus]